MRIVTILCLVMVIFLGVNIKESFVSEADNMQIKIGELTITIPKDMLCANVNSFLNVRIEPSANSAVIAKLNPGDTVKYLSEENGWSKIQIGDQIGYVYSKYTLKGTALKKYMKKNLNLFEINGVVKEKSYQAVYKNKKAAREDVATCTISGIVKAKERVYATKSADAQLKNEYEEVEKCVVAVDGLRFRSNPNMKSKVHTMFYSGQQLDIVSESNRSWMKVKHEGKTGYVSKDYVEVVSVKVAKSNIVDTLDKGTQLQVLRLTKNWAEISYGEETGFIKREKLNIETQEVETENVVGIVKNNESCMVLDVQDKLALVNVGDNAQGYVQAKALKAEVMLSSVDIDEEAVRKATQIVDNQDVSKVRRELVSYALQFVGNKYVWGGNSLTDGVDCSGFTQQIFASYGVSLYRCSYEQVKNGEEIVISELQPGDLVFYYNNKLERIGHVAIYIGDNKIVHAKSKNCGIVVDNLNYSTPYKAVNILGEK